MILTDINSWKKTLLNSLNLFYKFVKVKARGRAMNQKFKMLVF